MKATKQFKAEIAHRLVSSYSKKCQSIHGHSYLFEVTLEDEYLNGDGMVMDFGELKDKIAFMFDEWDHSLMLASFDPILEDMVKTSKEHNLRLIVVNFNPTAEYMAAFLYQWIKDTLDLPVKEVRVQETKTGWAVEDGETSLITREDLYIMDKYNVSE